MAKQMQPDVVMMDRYFGDVNELDKKIAIQASKLSGGGKTFKFCLSFEIGYVVQFVQMTYKM